VLAVSLTTFNLSALNGISTNYYLFSLTPAITFL
jgi:hypothetical protein